MNLFDHYEPIQADERKKALLSKKIAKLSKQRPRKRYSRFIVELCMAVTAILLFVIGLSFLTERIQPPFWIPGEKSPTDNEVTDDGSADVIASYLTFEGESTNWKAINRVYLRQSWIEKDGKLSGETFRDGQFVLIYKGDVPDTFSSFHLSIDGTARSSESRANMQQEPIYVTSGVYASEKDDHINVTVQWNGKTETFEMGYKPGTFGKNTADQVPELSDVAVFGDKPLVGLAGSGDFKIASSVNHWGKLYEAIPAFLGEIPRNKKIPALLSADGDHLVQTMFFWFSGVSPADDIKVVGTHNEKEKVFYSSDGDYDTGVLMTGRFGGDVTIPAVVRFEEEGVWAFTAYANDDPIGSVTVSVYQNPSLHLARHSKMREHTLRTFAASITADWFMENGCPALEKKPHMAIRVRQKPAKNMKNPDPFPIVIMGKPLADGEPFIQKIAPPDVKKTNTYYTFETDLPIEQQGKWSLVIFSGEYPMANVTFLVR